MMQRIERFRGGKRRAFSFVEVMIAIVILSCGLIPLLWNLLQATGHTKITVRQVQATNHAANLLEALRAVRFKDLVLFPPCRVQIEGGDNVWRAPGETPEVDFCMNEAYKAPGQDAETAFGTFVADFCTGEKAIVPPLEPSFRRYFIILKDDDDKPTYLTLVVRVEWMSLNPLGSEGEKRRHRSVELRTVVADPYSFGTSAVEG